MSDKKKIKVATTWLDGCSGCHMSFLDIDERLLELLEYINIVYGPLVDFKEVPKNIDLAIIEGAVSNEDDLKKVIKLRKNSRFLISLGDCAVSGNVPSMRNAYSLDELYARAYHENTDVQKQTPTDGVPPLLEHAEPLHAHIKVDMFIQGCPPPADAIYFVLCELIAGRVPDPTQVTRFGA